MLTILRPFRISGTGICISGKKILSKDIENQTAIPAGWIEKNSGVLERYQVKNSTAAISAAAAIQQALDSAGLNLSEVGMLISGAATFDQPLPNQSSLIKKEIKGANDFHFPCVDVDITCLGFVAALDYASRFVNNGQYRNIVVVCTEISSKGLNPDNWETYSLFGDAAVAVVVSFDESAASGIVHSEIRTYSEGVDYTVIRGGGNKFYPKEFPYQPELYSFDMQGMKLLRLAKKYIPGFFEDFFQQLPLSIKEVDHIIPHQASKMGLKLMYDVLDIHPEKTHSNLEQYGNCISASIPLMLSQGITSGRIKKGETCLLCGTSAGFSIGAALIRY